MEEEGLRSWLQRNLAGRDFTPVRYNVSTSYHSPQAGNLLVFHGSPKVEKNLKAVLPKVVE